MSKLFLVCAMLCVASSAAAGGWQEVMDTSTQEIEDLMSFVTNSMNARSNSIFLSKSGNIEHVERQLVNGFNFRVTFDSLETMCTKNRLDVDLSACKTNQNRVQRCSVEVYSSFAGKKQLNDFTCSAKHSVAKRAGGIKKVADPSKFMDTVQRALSMSNAALNNVKITSAKTQVVAGENIFLELEGNSLDGQITKCSINVWSRPWVQGNDGFKVTKFECDKDLTRGRREVVTGGLSDEVENPSDFLNTAKKALATSNSALEDVEVVRVVTQVVAGQKTYMTIRGTESGKHVLCDITVWTRSWIPEPAGFQVTNFKCVPQKTQRRALGGSHCAGCVSDEVSDPDSYMSLYIDAFGLAKTNMDINNIKIVSVKTQVVAGIRYIMKVETSEAGQPRLCDVQFVVSPWMNPSMHNVIFTCRSP